MGILTAPRLYYAMAADGLLWERAGRLHPKYRTPALALWLQAAVSLALLTTNTYDQLLSYVVFADWLFFGLTAAGLFVVRDRRHGEPAAGREPGAPPTEARAAEIAWTPGHPYTTLAFVAVAAGVVLNSFVAYPTQSSIGSLILAAAALVYFLTQSGRRRAPA